MISAIINKFGKKTVVIVSSISVGIIVVAGLIILFSAGASKTEKAFDYQAIAQEYGVSENVAYLIGRTQQYNENADVKMLANMSITEIVDNLRNEYVNVFKYKEIAQEYGVSQDIAYIANRIVMIDSNADMELLVNLPITELVDTLREKLLQAQTPAAEEENLQDTEIAYTDDTEDVDTENDDSDTPDSGTNSDDTETEVPKPTQKPKEETNKEWSEWSEWMSVEKAESVVYNQGDTYREFELDFKQQWRTATEEYRHKWRYKKIEDSDWSDWSWESMPSKIEDGWGTIYDVDSIWEFDPDASTFGEWQDDNSTVEHIYSNEYQIRVVARYRFFG